MGARFLESICVAGFGEAAASGQLSFYQVGTLTPATVFSDDALSQAVTQPIVLDAVGKAPMALYSATPLRAIVNTSSGATLQDIERVDGDRAELVRVDNNPNWTPTDLNSILSTLAASLGGTNGQFKDAGAGAVGRSVNVKFAEVQISVKDYGAVGNGVANDTASVQATVNRVISLGGGTVFFPPGAYNISSEITLAFASATMSLRLSGSGSTTSRVVQTSATANTFTATLGANAQVIIEYLGLTATSTSGVAFAGVSTMATTVENVLVSGHESGFTNISSGDNTNGKTCLFMNVDILCRNASAGVGVSGELNSVTMVGCLILAPNAAAGFVGISFTANTAVTSPTFQSFGTTVFVNSATGKCVNIPAPCPPGGVFFQGGAILGPAATTVTIAAAVATYVQVPSYVAVTDSRTAGVAALSLSGNGNVAPVVGFPMRVIQNTAATTVNITGISPASTIMGGRISLMCINNSGGAVTWSFAAMFKTSGAVAPATGNCTAISFLYDSVSAVAREETRATAAI